MDTLELIQGSDEWLRARLGKVTASRVADIVAKTKTGWGASRKNYMAELISERLTGVPAEKYTNSAMQWGTEHEAQARAAYEFFESASVRTVGFVPHPTIPLCGASPDGLVGDDGLIEIKCPGTATHIDTLLNKTIDGKYVIQVQFQMSVTGRKWCDWCSFDPRLPEDLRLFVKRIPRDDEHIAELDAAVREFQKELDATLARLRPAEPFPIEQMERA